MTNPSVGAQIFRRLSKELRHIQTKNLNEAPVYQYMLDQFKKHEVTSEKICKGKHDVQHVAETYICLLQSIRKHQELTELYGGKGERSIEASAAIVGLRLPKTPQPDS